MKRFEELRYENLTQAQKQIYDEIASGPRGRVRGPLAVWLARPDFADKAQKLGQYARYDTVLPPRLSELAILLMARIWAAEFEWWAHRKIAENAGISKEIVDSIQIGKKPAYDAEDEKIVHDFTVNLYCNKKIDDDIYRQATKLLGEEGVVDLVGILGYYTLISMTINVFQVETPQNVKAELSEYNIDSSFFATGD